MACRFVIVEISIKKDFWKANPPIDERPSKSLVADCGAHGQILANRAVGHVTSNYSLLNPVNVSLILVEMLLAVNGNLSNTL